MCFFIDILNPWLKIRSSPPTHSGRLSPSSSSSPPPSPPPIITIWKPTRSVNPLFAPNYAQLVTLKYKYNLAPYTIKRLVLKFFLKMKNTMHKLRLMRGEPHTLIYVFTQRQEGSFPLLGVWIPACGAGGHTCRVCHPVLGWWHQNKQ